MFGAIWNEEARDFKPPRVSGRDEFLPQIVIFGEVAPEQVDVGHFPFAEPVQKIRI